MKSHGKSKAVLSAIIFEVNLLQSSRFGDPFVWKENGLYRMIAKDMHGNVCKEKYGGVYAWSESGEQWNVVKGQTAYSRNVLWSDGQVRLMGNLDRPFILFEEGKARCIYFAVSDGTDSFMDASNTWNAAIPLKQ